MKVIRASPILTAFILVLILGFTLAPTARNVRGSEKPPPPPFKVLDMWIGEGYDPYWNERMCKDTAWAAIKIMELDKYDAVSIYGSTILYDPTGAEITSKENVWQVSKSSTLTADIKVPILRNLTLPPLLGWEAGVYTVKLSLAKIVYKLKDDPDIYEAPISGVHLAISYELKLYLRLELIYENKTGYYGCFFRPLTASKYETPSGRHYSVVAYREISIPRMLSIISGKLKVNHGGSIRPMSREEFINGSIRERRFVFGQLVSVFDLYTSLTSSLVNVPFNCTLTRLDDELKPDFIGMDGSFEYAPRLSVPSNYIGHAKFKEGKLNIGDLVAQRPDASHDFSIVRVEIDPDPSEIKPGISINDVRVTISFRNSLNYITYTDNVFVEIILAYKYRVPPREHEFTSELSRVSGVVYSWSAQRKNFSMAHPDSCFDWVIDDFSLPSEELRTDQQITSLVLNITIGRLLWKDHVVPILTSEGILGLPRWSSVFPKDEWVFTKNLTFTVGRKGAPSSDVAFYETVVKEDGSQSKRPVEGLKVTILNRDTKARSSLITCSNGWLSEAPPWIGKKSGEYVPGLYIIRFNKEDKSLREKYGTTFLYPKNEIRLRVDKSGNMKVEAAASAKVSIKGKKLNITLMSIVSFDNYIKSSVISFLRATGLVLETDLSMLAGLNTLYGTGNSEFDPANKVIKIWRPADEQFAEVIDPRTRKVIPVDFQTVFHEWGHAVKHILLPDPWAKLGGEHANPAVPSSLELAYDEGHAEFFACLLIDYCQVESSPHDRYVSGYKGPHKQANMIEGRIAGFWLSLNGLEKKPADPIIAVKAYEDFLRTSLVFQRIFYEGTQRSPTTPEDWKRTFDEWRFWIRSGVYKRPPRTIEEWIYMRIAIAKDLKEIQGILSCAKERGFNLPKLSYPNMIEHGKVSGKPYLMIGFVNVYPPAIQTPYFTLKGSEDIGVAILSEGDRIEGTGSDKREEFLKSGGGSVIRIDPVDLRIIAKEDVLGGSTLVIKKDSFELVNPGTLHVGSHGIPILVTTKSGEKKVIILSRSEVEVVAKGRHVLVNVFEGHVDVNSSRDHVKVTGGSYVEVADDGSISEVQPIEEGNKWWEVNVASQGYMTTVQSLTLYKVTGSEEGAEESSVFTYEDEYVIAVVKVISGVKGDELKWIFRGPNDIVFESTYTLEKSGDGEYYSVLDLYNYAEEEVIGSWIVAIYVNGKEVHTVTFEVRGTVRPHNIMAVVESIFCKKVENGRPEDITDTFTTDEKVFSYIKVENASEGDEVTWVFQGPSGVNRTVSCTLDWSGSGYCYAVLDLRELSSEDITGSWRVSVYVNGEEVLEDYFQVVQKEGCLIATATYGSELAGEVQFLRKFRDDMVITTFAGRNFISVFNAWYYSFSPTIAGFIAHHSILRALMRIILYPLIGILHLSYEVYEVFKVNAEIGIILAGTIASSLIGLAYFSMPLAGLLVLMGWLKRKAVRLGRLKPLVPLWVLSILSMALGEFLRLPLLMMISTSSFVLSTLFSSALIIAVKIAERALH